MDQIIAAIKEFLFGCPIKGEQIDNPSFKSTYPEDYNGYSELHFSSWFNEMNFGKRLTNRPILW